MKKFNVTGTCIPHLNYMVDLTPKLLQIKEMVDSGDYFTINRGQQYGKTTTLLALENFIIPEYAVISLSLEGIGVSPFECEEKFVQTFLSLVQDSLEMSGQSNAELWWNEEVKDFKSLGRHIRKVCQNSEKKFVLLIDEVDKASNYQVFLQFLGKLRDKYLAQRAGKDFTFHSVILAGVHDIKNLRFQVMNENETTPSGSYHSPWNISADFNIRMSFSVDEISGMLREYIASTHVIMDIFEVASEIHTYTNGYPVLVSNICKKIDEKLDKDWTSGGVRRAVKLILKEENPLFETLIKNISANESLESLLRSVIDRKAIMFNIHNPALNLCYRYGYISDVKDKVKISNKIFEVILMNYFASQLEISKILKSTPLNNDESGIIVNNQFNMDLCLQKFSAYFNKYYDTKDERFIERQGRLLFLMFLAPLLNGQGFAYILNSRFYTTRSGPFDSKV